MLAAFDAALRDVGVANYNLIRLSSVIPAGSTLTKAHGPITPPGHWGDRLYVVLADARTDTPGTDAWAGLGWIQDPHTGRGLFVEHEGYTEVQVRADIEDSLNSLQHGRDRAGEPLTERQTITAGTTCSDQPACALTIAVFAAEPWAPERLLR